MSVEYGPRLVDWMNQWSIFRCNRIRSSCAYMHSSALLMESRRRISCLSSLSPVIGHKLYMPWCMTDELIWILQYARTKRWHIDFQNISHSLSVPSDPRVVSISFPALWQWCRNRLYIHAGDDGAPVMINPANTILDVLSLELRAEGRLLPICCSKIENACNVESNIVIN